MRRDGSGRSEKQRAARSGKRRGSREGENSSRSIAHRAAVREAEDEFLALVQLRIDRKRGSGRPDFVLLADVLRELLGEAEAAADSRAVDIALDAMDALGIQGHQL